MARRKKKRVLVVDDNADMVSSALSLLRLHGYDARGADNAMDIVACVREYDPGAVIMDLAMPGKNGWDAARELRGEIHGRRPLLIALTAERSTGAHKVGSPGDFDYFLTKPCDLNVLLALVGQAR